MVHNSLGMCYCLTTKWNKWLLVLKTQHILLFCTYIAWFYNVASGWYKNILFLENHIKTLHYISYVNAPFLQSIDKFSCIASKGYQFLVSVLSCYSIGKESFYFIVQFVDNWILKWVSTSVHECISLFHQCFDSWFMTCLVQRAGSVEMGMWTRLKHNVEVCDQLISLKIIHCKG